MTHGLTGLTVRTHQTAVGRGCSRRYTELSIMASYTQRTAGIAPVASLYGAVACRILLVLVAGRYGVTEPVGTGWA